MNPTPEMLLLGGVIAVGVLHTIVPDHWLPIAILARQQGWSRGETAWAAARAGFGHVASTLLLGLLVWLGGVALAERFGVIVDLASSAALVGFGLWIAWSAWREIRGPNGHHHHHGHEHGSDHHHDHGGAGHHHHGDNEWNADALYLPLGGGVAVLAHSHVHRHGGGQPHVHWHDHPRATAHDIAPGIMDAIAADPPLHQHRHKTSARAALVLILGSSPMVEGIPAFFAAGKYGSALIGVMAVAFGLSTIATYVALCVTSVAGLRLLRFGNLERYGEMLSGGLIALIGLAFGVVSTV
jgi:nickel/cobalt transporter (NicO) family protein